MVQCPSCGGRLEPPRLVCAQCGGPVAAELDGFAALGLERKLVIDPAALERAYHELSRQIHPDRFVQSAPAVRQASLRATALLTRSYRHLRDPVSRGRYWLELNGEPLGEDNNRVAPELAELVFGVQEELGELRAARRGNGGSRSLIDQVESRRRELAQAYEQAARDLETNFARWDADDGGGREGLATELKAILSRLAYLRTLTRDVERELEEATASLGS